MGTPKQSMDRGGVDLRFRNKDVTMVFIALRKWAISLAATSMFISPS